MQIHENYSLKRLNTFSIDSKAKYFVEVSSVDDIRNFFKNENYKSFPFLILGGGSNILLTKNFEGVVMKINIIGKNVVSEDDEHIYIKAGAGENWHNFVLHCIENNFAGIENLSLIPGCVGAAPMQNIGAYGVELKDVFCELEALMIDSQKIKKFKECKFGYRESIFKNELKGKAIIVSVTLRLNKKPVFNTSYGAIEEELKKMGVEKLSIKAISEAVCNIRRSKLPNPAEIGNAGSFFKNPMVTKEKYEELKKEFSDVVGYDLTPDPSPLERGEKQLVKLAAGWLIEKAGWKGKTFGNCGVHKNQALVLVNYGNASGNEIYELSQKILGDIKAKFGVELEREVNVV